MSFSAVQRASAASISPIQFEKVVVAWDGSRVAARAVGDALPALALAKTVSVVTVGDEPDDAAPAASLVRNLVAHGVAAQAEKIALKISVGAALRDHVHEVGADLLVMRAYGHSRLRDFVLGGATRSILADPLVSVWLSR
ncbi:hypothetical protein SLNSH_23880 [Alsobacter soli]|uniref:UspA domain-containing protein n=1 Tax=Alsobacter soli TaxID=2109933 RepID=A0A2T1HLG3_9HYPH|nr:universal stress protein [Alsobacter soli]PSC02482.1 hypothetical protein SLNSH_23880 [Alsobacter soli]